MALTTTTEAESAARKKRKGKNFCAEEERQLCRSFLAVSQDPIPGNGRRTPAFWDRIHEHYTKNKPENAGERPARSLESKWGIIKHEVEKFDGCYGAVLALNEAGTSVEDVLRRALELYKLKHPKGLSFSFIHCWLLLKDIPKWAETSLTDEKKTTTTTTTTPVATTTTPTTMVKRKPTDMLLPRWADTSNEAKKTTPPVTTTTMKRKPTASSMVEGSEDCEVVESLSDSGESSPSGRKAVEWRRKNKKTQKLKESTMRAQAKATADMAAATLMKAEILQDQSALALFTMPDDQLTSAEAREYLQLRRQEELLKLRRRLAESNNKSIITTITATTPAAAVVATSTPAATNTMTTTTNIDTTTTTSITTTPQQPNSGMSTNPTAT